MTSPDPSVRALPADHPWSAAAEDGFTLIEMLVAAVMLSLGLLATATVFASSDSTTLDAELQQIATEQAELAVEEIRALDYPEVGHTANVTGEPTPPTGDNGLGGSGTTYDGPDNDTEELVVPANSQDGDSDSGIITPALQTRTFSVETDPGNGGAQTVTGTVYTFITWRDEECEALDVDELDLGLTELRDDLNALRSTLNTLSADVLAIFGTLSLLPTSIRSIYETTIPNLIADIDGRITDIDDLIGDLSTATIDICDLSDAGLDAIQNLVDPSGVGELSASADILGVNSQVDASVAAVNVPLISSLLCSALGTFCADSNSLQTTITSSGISATLSGINADTTVVSDFLTFDTTHNTKRVTVAVTIDTGRNDLTPKNPVYLHTVVVDPEDGLL